MAINTPQPKTIADLKLYMEKNPKEKIETILQIIQNNNIGSNLTDINSFIQFLDQEYNHQRGKKQYHNIGNFYKIFNGLFINAAKEDQQIGREYNQNTLHNAWIGHFQEDSQSRLGVLVNGTMLYDVYDKNSYEPGKRVLSEYIAASSAITDKSCIRHFLKALEEVKINRNIKFNFPKAAFVNAVDDGNYRSWPYISIKNIDNVLLANPYRKEYDSPLKITLDIPPIATPSLSYPLSAIRRQKNIQLEKIGDAVLLLSLEARGGYFSDSNIKKICTQNPDILLIISDVLNASSGEGILKKFIKHGAKNADIVWFADFYQKVLNYNKKEKNKVRVCQNMDFSSFNSFVSSLTDKQKDALDALKPRDNYLKGLPNMVKLAIIRESYNKLIPHAFQRTSNEKPAVQSLEELSCYCDEDTFLDILNKALHETQKSGCFQNVAMFIQLKLLEQQTSSIEHKMVMEKCSDMLAQHTNNLDGNAIHQSDSLSLAKKYNFCLSLRAIHDSVGRDVVSEYMKKYNGEYRDEIKKYTTEEQWNKIIDMITEGTPESEEITTIYRNFGCAVIDSITQDRHHSIGGRRNKVGPLRF